MNTAEFLAVLGHERATYQLFPDREQWQGKGLTRILHGPIDRLQRRLQMMNRAGAGIYFMVNYGDLRGRSERNVVGISAYFADLDGTPLLPVDSYPLLPTVVTCSSPDRYHLYWRVSGAPIESFSHVQKHIATLLDGDLSVHDPPRVMRLPNFYHLKRKPFMVTVIHCDETACYTHEVFCEAFAVPEYRPIPPLPKAAEQYVNGKRQPGDRHKLLDKIANAGEGSRNDTLFRLACALANEVAASKLDRDTMMQEAIAAAAQSGLPETEARRTIQSALRYANAN